MGHGNQTLCGNLSIEIVVACPGRLLDLMGQRVAKLNIDVSRISHVINYDMPDTAIAYTHRIGRTGRLAELGTALSLATQDDLPMVRTIERLLGRSLERRKLARFDAR